ncbi:MAG: c-type cytochrome [Pirellulaceae bacterium]|nr:c-type cytochrome [Pirellulaceae bacterium]
MRFLVAISLLLSGSNLLAQETDTPLRWTTSRVIGTPDPPLPYTIERVYADAPLKRPVEMVRVPQSDRWIVVDVSGKIQSFDKSDPSELRLAIDLKQVVPTTFRAYGITFHPQYPDVAECYIAYSPKQRDLQGTRVSSFCVTDTSIPIIDPKSEVVFAGWNSEGHSGGSLHFGPDGYLYISVGDGQDPNPPDKLNTGQDLSDFEASILRIDVNATAPPLPYRIPDDNPFVGLPNVKAEIWAFGLRNPWKMSFNPKDGSLWTGDVGWEMREMVYRVDRGGNYGWSHVEGSQVVKRDAARSDIPISPPIVEHDHVVARSITGGYFWQSDRIPELQDAYIYGDWMTGKIWGLKYEDGKVTWHREIADTTLQIICFALDDDGEVLTVGYDGTIHRFVPNNRQTAAADFPRRLSETGLFTSVTDQTPASGVVPYYINAHHWSDHTQSKQWIGLTGDEPVTVFQKSNWEVGQVAGFCSFPHNTVLAKTVSYQSEVGAPESVRHLETQILHRNGDDWNAYNYVWNQEQDDAVLQDNVASYQDLIIRDPNEPDGIRKQTWLHASRDQCSLCHIWSAGTVHGFKLDQLNRTHESESINQLDKLVEQGILGSRPADVGTYASPHDPAASLEARARSYLDLNCAHCHRRGGGGTAAFDLISRVPTDELNLIDALPTQGTFGIPDARVVAAGDPGRSVLLYRMLKSGRGRMPQFGPTLIDDRGIQIVNDWIASLKSSEDDPIIAAPSVDLFDNAITRDYQQIQQAIKGLVDPDADKGDRVAKIRSLLSTVPSALSLSLACADQEFPVALRGVIADHAASSEHGEIRDLFERFLPPERRIARLGTLIDADHLLAMTGNAQRGRELYFESSGMTCRQCHRIGDQGPAVGPPLDRIGLLRKPNEILHSILQPSAIIDPKYRSYVALQSDGTVLSGFLTEQSDTLIRLVDAQSKVHDLDPDDLEDLRPSAVSLMPDHLLAESTAQQAADLLAFLASLQEPELVTPQNGVSQ